MDLSVFAPELAILHDKTVQLFLKEKVPSDYIGDTYEWKPNGKIACSVLPVTDKLTIETFGQRVEQMLLLHVAPDARIENGMGIVLHADAIEPSHTVVTVKKRLTHTYVLVEVINSGNQSGGAG